jgi:hypothetical protein
LWRLYSLINEWTRKEMNERNQLKGWRTGYADESSKERFD